MNSRLVDLSRVDEEVEEIMEKGESRAVSFYMMACYLYYDLNESMMSDTVFDKLCNHLLYEVMMDGPATAHPHAKFLDPEALKAGTGNSIKHPNSVIGAANRFMKEYSK